MKVHIEATVMEGWSDRPGPRKGRLSIDAELPSVPRVGDYFEDHRVETVFWSLGGPPIVRLRYIYTGNNGEATPQANFDAYMAAMRAEGWS